MSHEFVSMTLPKEDLKALHRGLLARHLMEEIARREAGLEEIEYPKALVEIERLLGLDDEAAHALYHEVEDELWEYAWYAYTDEWAWHRARRDVLRELGSKAGPMKRDALDRLIEDRYEKGFDAYVGEIDMREEKEAVHKPKTKKK